MTEPNSLAPRLLELRRTACTAAQAGASAFARRVTNLESQTAQTQGVISASLAVVHAYVYSNYNLERILLRTDSSKRTSQPRTGLSKFSKN